MLTADGVPEALLAVIRRAAEIAMAAGLGQVVLRTLSPGVPDCYQGTETWDDSLVDPDNRRPVPFEERHELLADLAGSSAEELLEHRRDGRVKAHVLQRALRARADHPGCVDIGSGYLPLAVEGRWADHVVAFARVSSDASDALLVIAPRLPGAVMGDDARPPIGDMWGDTTVTVPGFVQGTYRDVFAGGSGDIGDAIEVSALLATLPVAVLERTTDTAADPGAPGVVGAPARWARPGPSPRAMRSASSLPPSCAALTMTPTPRRSTLTRHSTRSPFTASATSCLTSASGPAALATFSCAFFLASVFGFPLAKPRTKNVPSR